MEVQGTMVKVGIVNKSDNPLPGYACAGDTGMDIRAYLPQGPVTIEPGKICLIGTGIFVDLPVGYGFQVRSRSGLSLKHGIIVLNSPGTIDEPYTNEVGVILFNAGQEPFIVNSGDRIAQLVLEKVEKVTWDELEEITKETERGLGGYGHTGVK